MYQSNFICDGIKMTLLKERLRYLQEASTYVILKFLRHNTHLHTLNNLITLQKETYQPTRTPIRNSREKEWMRV